MAPSTVGGIRGRHAADLLGGIARIEQRTRLARLRLAGQDGRRAPGLLRGAIHVAHQAIHRLAIGEIEAGRIRAFGREQVHGQRNARMRHALQCVHFGHRIGHHLLGRQARIDDAIDERRVGAVFEQAPHEVGQQVLVRAHGRVHAAGIFAPGPAHHAVVQLRAHAMQALELEAIGVAAEHFRHVRDGVRIVRGELRIHALAGAFEQARAGEVGDVGVRFAREHRVAREPALLRALDLAVPVRTLDETQRDAPVGFAQPLHQPFDAWRRRASDTPAPRGRSPQSLASRRSSSSLSTSNSDSSRRSASSASSVTPMPASRAWRTSVSMTG